MTKKTKKKTAKKTRAKKKTKELVITKGDFLLMEMTGRAVETGEVFDTTDEETAKNESIYKEDKTYGSELVVVGEGWVLKGLDERLPGVKLNQKVEIEISPEEERLHSTDAEFIGAIREGTQVSPDFEEGLHYMEFLEVCRKSF